MNIFKSTGAMRPAVALLLGLSCAGSYAALPKSDFACQVQVSGGAMGLVLVQADTQMQARQMAVGAPAKTSAGRPRIATAVVECILYRQGKFKDSAFQEFFVSLPG